MARTYFRAKHRPAVLCYSETGKLLVAAVGFDLPVTAFSNIAHHLPEPSQTDFDAETFPSQDPS